MAGQAADPDAKPGAVRSALHLRQRRAAIGETALSWRARSGSSGHSVVTRILQGAAWLGWALWLV